MDEKCVPEIEVNRRLVTSIVTLAIAANKGSRRGVSSQWEPS